MRNLSHGIAWIAAVAGIAVGCGNTGSGAGGSASLQPGAQGGSGGATNTAADAGAGGTAGAAGGAGGTNTDAAVSGPLTDAQVVGVLRAANQGEVDEANHALSCLRNDATIGFARQMITEHTAARARVDALATRLGDADSPEKTSLTITAQSAINAYDAAAAVEGSCDQIYIDTQVAGHATVLTLIDQVLLPSANDATLQAELQAERPTVAAHLAEAKRIQAALETSGTPPTPPDGGDNQSLCFVPGAAVNEAQAVKLLLLANQDEIDEADLELSKGTAAPARAFAQKMIDDHSAALTRLQALVTSLDVAPAESTESQILEKQAQSSDAVLQSVQPPALDRTYIDMQVLDHTSVLALIDQVILPSVCTLPLRTEIENERAVVATHLNLAVTTRTQVQAASATDAGR